MPSKMSWFNKEVMLQIGRSTGWVSVVYFLGLLFILPIQLLIIYSDEDDRLYQNTDNLFSYNFEFQIGLFAIVPIILAVFLFRFLHAKQATDLMHSLPLKRTRIFHYYALTGMLFLIIPVVAITFIILLMHNTLDLGSLFSVKDIFYWAGTTTVITLLLYTAAVFIAMLTGMSTVQAVLAYVFLFFPVGITLLMFYNLKILLYGFPSDYFFSRQFEKLSPITYAAVLDSKRFPWNDGVLYIILIIVMYGLALLLYKKRNLETASEAIAFPKLRSVFKYGVTFCMMLLGGSYFHEVSFNSNSWTIFGYAIGAALGYLAAEMILQKTWRVFARVKGLIIYLALIAVFGIGVQILGIYENKIPEEAEIKNVILTDNFGYYMGSDDIYSEYYSPVPMKEKANIEAVRKLHKQIVADEKINQQRQDDRSVNFFIRYEMKDGSYLTREYTVNERLYEDFFKPIYESKEYKLTTNEVFKLKENKIKKLTIGGRGPITKGVTLSNPDEIKEAIAALRQDVLAESYEDRHYFEGQGSMIEVSLGSDHFLNFEIKPTYQHFTKWLKQKELLKGTMVTADDITHVLVAKRDTSKTVDLENIKNEVEKSADKFDVTNKEQIQKMLDNASPDSSHGYVSIFYYHFGDYFEVMFFDEKHAPEFVKGHFK
ncbi:multidrug ABC transporter permease [Neobacillus sp. NRS-1170]|uniref:multidrug ABC transporter permease n=1 Tax=Neobacillus sp. NRS-1170 TaxID=3233898 RepID=UPI003D2DD919